ncbi:hypothetical protein KAS50_02165 [bacterium]|nr:hypothetical protein [bacterium]
MLADNLKDEIRDFLSEERAVLKSVLRYMWDVDRMVSGDKHEEAGDVLQQSRDESGKIAEIEKRLKVLLDSNDVTIEDVKKEFKEETAGISDILLKISELDDKVEVLLQEKRGSVLESFKKLQIGKKIHGNYLRDLKGHNGSINIIE